MLTDAERHASRDLAEHFKRETEEYERQRGEVAAILIKDRANTRAANRSVRLSNEYDRLRKAIREQDGSYRFPLVSDEGFGEQGLDRSKLVG